MLKEIFHYIYCMSIPSTVFILISVCCLWKFVELKIKKQKKLWQVFNLLLFVVWFVCIIYMTVLTRAGKTEINFIPFRFIYEPFRTGNEEFFRTGWMNILLFVPGGMFLSYGISKPTKIKRVLQIVVLIAISVDIEILQWYYKLGVVEIDDVICNTFGAIIGVTSVAWTSKIVEYVKYLIQNIIKEIRIIKNKT